MYRGYDLAIAWSSILVFDAVVFILTLLQALKAGRSLSGSYLRVMLRDGEQSMSFSQPLIPDATVCFRNGLLCVCLNLSLDCVNGAR